MTTIAKLKQSFKEGDCFEFRGDIGRIYLLEWAASPKERARYIKQFVKLHYNIFDPPLRSIAEMERWARKRWNFYPPSLSTFLGIDWLNVHSQWVGGDPVFSTFEDREAIAALKLIEREGEILTRPHAIRRAKKLRRFLQD